MSSDPTRRACEAHSDLNIFAAVVKLLEGGLLYRGQKSYRAAERIITICKTEQQRCIREYDAAVAIVVKKMRRP